MGMRFLLDTPTFLWLIGEPERLPGTLVDLLADENNPLLVSAASAMEVATKVRLGKLPAAAHLVAPAVWSARVREIGADPLSLTTEHALLAGSLAWTHRDPFDRFLAAQALAENATLATCDVAFAGVEGLSRIWFDRPIATVDTAEL